MTKKTFYPATITQTTGGKFQSFKDLKNIKNNSSKYAESTSLIHGKKSSPNRPSSVTCSNFKMKIPVGSIINSVTVEYAQYKVAYNKKVPALPAPTVYLTKVTNAAKKGQTPTTKSAKKTITFKKGAKSLKGKIGDMTFTKLNNSNFAVKFDYPANTNNNEGKLRIQYIRLIVDYTEPAYSFSWKDQSELYNTEDYSLQITMNNSKGNKYNPTCTFTVPAGFNLKSNSGSGTVVQVNARTFRWVPNFSKGAKNASRTFVFSVDVTFSGNSTTYSGTFTITESVRNTISTYTKTVTNRPAKTNMEITTATDETIITDENEAVKTIVNDTDYTFQIEIDTNLRSAIINAWNEYLVSVGQTPLTSNYCYGVVKIRESGAEERIISEWDDQDLKDNILTIRFTATNPGLCYIDLGLSKQIDTRVKTWTFLAIPKENTLNPPVYSLLSLSTEELNRLGTGKVYIAETFLKIQNSTTKYVNNWYKNYRLGIFNNPVEKNLYYTYDIETVNEEFTVEFHVPSWVDTGTYTKVYYCKTDDSDDGETWNNTPITFTDNVPNTDSTDITGNILNITLSKKSKNYEKFNIFIWDSNTSKHILSYEYTVHFNSEEDSIEETLHDTTDYANLTSEQIFENTENWSNAPSTLEEWNEVTCEFTYDENYPLYILITGQYANEGQYDIYTEFLEPCLIEEYTERLPNGNFPVPILSLLGQNEESAECIVPVMNSSNNIILYDLPIGEQFSTDETQAVRGIKLTADIQTSDDIVIYSALKDTQGNTGQRSVIIDSSTEQIEIGGFGDLWGYNTLDIINLEDWELTMTASNLLNDSDVNILLSNAEITIYTQTLPEQNIQMLVDGQDIRYFGAFLTNAKIPEGLKTDTDYINIAGTDTNDPYRQNITEKTIEVTLDISDTCSLDDNTNSLRELTRVLVNERDKYNRPIPKRVEFSHYPDVYWEYIIEDAFDNELDISNYTVKLKLVIPAGTSYNKTDTVTSNIGTASGLANVQPTIQLRPSGENIEVRETISGQKFNIGYSGSWNEKLVEIDCSTQTVWLLENEDDDNPINITSYSDINVDWFILHGEYNFEADNATIRTITFTERW